jgi:HEAT repeat protein
MATVEDLIHTALYDTDGEMVEGAFVDRWESNAANAIDRLERLLSATGQVGRRGKFSGPAGEGEAPTEPEPDMPVTGEGEAPAESKHDAHLNGEGEAPAERFGPKACDAPNSLVWRIRKAVSEPEVPMEAAAHLLAVLGKWTQPMVESMLTEPAPKARQIALLTLGAFLADQYRGAYPVDPALILRALGDEAAVVRETAIVVLCLPRVLTKVENLELHFELATLHPEPSVRVAAASALILLNRSSGGEALVRYLEQEQDASARAKVIIATAQKIRGDGIHYGRRKIIERSGAAIEQMLVRELNHHDANVRREVAGALERLAAADAMLDRAAVETDRDVLLALLHYPGPGYSAIAERSLPVLTRLLETHSDGAIQNEIAWLLGSFGRPAVPVLLSILENFGAAARRGAVIGLGRIGDPVALPAIERELERTEQGFYRSEIETAIRSLKARKEQSRE